MQLWLFLVMVFERFGIAITVEPWYYAAVTAIGLIPVDQVQSILTSYGHVSTPDQPFCGMTFMQDNGYFNRTVPQIWIAEPELTRCTVDQLRFSIEHELRHVLTWIRDGLAVWVGH